MWIFGPNSTSLATVRIVKFVGHKVWLSGNTEGGKPANTGLTAPLLTKSLQNRDFFVSQLLDEHWLSFLTEKFVTGYKMPAVGAA